MNIQRAENKIIEYPEIEEVNQKKLKKSIPKKWLKLGITSFLFELIMKKSAFAVSTPPVANYSEGISIPSGTEQSIAGGQATNTAGVISAYACSPVFIVALIIFIVNIKRVIHIKREQKKYSSNEKVKKSTKILIIVSVILMLISIIAQPTVEYILKHITISV